MNNKHNETNDVNLENQVHDGLRGKSAVIGVDAEAALGRNERDSFGTADVVDNDEEQLDQLKIMGRETGINGINNGRFS